MHNTYHTMAKCEIRSLLSYQLLRQKPTVSDYERFCKLLEDFKEKTSTNESEEYNKNHMRDFLLDAFYRDKYNINTKRPSIDYAIYDDDVVSVIIENKSPSNKAEFITKEHLNRKALQELVLYFMRERIGANNLQIKHLIVTNNYEWYIFDAKLFDTLFASDKSFVKIYKEFAAGNTSDTKTIAFYTNIAAPKIDEVLDKLDYAYFDIRYIKGKKEMVDIYKLLSPAHLLKQIKFADSNALNTRFYNELLHIIGLEEVKEDGKKKIITRVSASSRNKCSLLESTLEYIEDRVDKNSQFDTALGAVIVWINRILFLKLLESQLISYHPKEAKNYKFLTIDNIKDYDVLNRLFFRVLAIPVENRNPDMLERFPHVPYLNSALFERNDVEKYCEIGNLELGKMPLYSKTILRDVHGHMVAKEMNTLEYLFRFLDAYDFGAEQNDDEVRKENKTLINASVLGLIFEKLNGYKDGSFFTPGVVTEHMAKSSINSAVIKKFNEVKGWYCQSLSDVYNQLDRIELSEANAIVNSITICDPAVGSGHFLVSVLNQLIAIKSELQILVDKNGKKLRDWEAKVENDELVVVYKEDKSIFTYNPMNASSQVVQETLFHEKRTIIEKCLFGVDLNPNSVNICRLRLWIELLKNAFYREDGQLETLPNIDINIKCGNSLVSQFQLDCDLSDVLRKCDFSVDKYRSIISQYHNASSKVIKEEMRCLIDDFKSKLKTNILITNPDNVRLRKLKTEYDILFGDNRMFQSEILVVSKKKDKSRKMKLEKEISALERKIADLKSNAKYKQSMDWRIEFPEVLDADGKFVGFDVVIANPPYISTKDVSEEEKKLYTEIYGFSDDTYNLFTFLGVNLVRQGGDMIYITPKTFWTNQTKRNMRDLLFRNRIVSFFDVGNPFSTAMVDTCVTHLYKIQTEEDYGLTFWDGSQSITDPVVLPIVNKSVFVSTPNSVIFKPLEKNLKFVNAYSSKARELMDKWWSKIETSKDVEDNVEELSAYRKGLKPGDVALLGCLAEGGQGMATGNNGRFLAVRSGSKWADTTRRDRVVKLQKALKDHPQISYDFRIAEDVELHINSMSESEIANMFDSIKEKYGRDVFGKGFIYRIISDDELRDPKTLTDEEKENGIGHSDKHYVPYEKGDKDGNRWLLDTPYAIEWTRENVDFLKSNSGKKGKGMPVVRNSQYYFRDGFCWILTLNENSEYQKARLKSQSVNDVNAMAMYPCEDYILPSEFYVALLNSYFIFQYKHVLVNNSSAFQINDARQLPIVIPTQQQLDEFVRIYNEAVEIKQNGNDEEMVKDLQYRLDQMTLKLYGLE